jgi:anionic cell wall polymer biosynthesis LytR-Cps2A-Psr (LCP) family protein
MAKTKVFYKPKKKKTPAKAKGKLIARKVKKKLKLFAFAFFAIGITALVLTGVSAYKFMNAPFSGAANGSEVVDGDAIWKKDETNILLLHVNDLNSKSAEIKDLFLVNFDGTNNRYAIYKIPVDEEIEYALNYGKGTLRNVYARGNQDQDRGIYLTEKTVLKQLAVKIDGYVVIDEKGSEKLLGDLNGVNPNDLSAALRLKNWPKIPGLISDFREITLTNLKLSDLYSIVTFIRQTSETSSKVVELSKYQLTDTNLWDSLWQESLSLSEVKHEAIKVFVLNASANPRIPGLATWGTRIAQNTGASVLEGDNSFEEFDENTIITDNPDLATVRKLAQTLGIKKIIHTNDLNRDLDYNQQIFRTEVTLVLVSAL